MKTVLCFALLFTILCLPALALADDKSCLSSGVKSSSGAIITGSGTLCGVQALTDGTNNATCVVYDNKSAASGNVVGKGISLGAALSGGSALPTTFGTGLYLSVSGTNANCIVYFRSDN